MAEEAMSERAERCPTCGSNDRYGCCHPWHNLLTPKEEENAYQKVTASLRAENERLKQRAAELEKELAACEAALESGYGLSELANSGCPNCSDPDPEVVKAMAESAERPAKEE